MFYQYLHFFSCFGLILSLFTCQTQSSAKKVEEVAETPVIESASELEIKAPQYRQLVLVQTPDWDAIEGTLRRFEFGTGGWEEIGTPIEIVVGKKGMGWGSGMEDFRQMGGPVKKEGDLKSPAGVFEIGEAFGYAAKEKIPWLKTNYMHVVASTMCIEDGKSSSYNRILDENEAEADWNSTDHMLRNDDLYEWGAFVRHNYPESQAGGGSCIFLHVWRNRNSGTAGCTAMEKPNMVEVLKWLDESQNPVLVQIPTPTYKLIKDKYKLPSLE